LRRKSTTLNFYNKLWATVLAIVLIGATLLGVWKWERGSNVPTSEVKGQVVDFRTVADQVANSQMGSKIIYRGEYKVEYFVNSNKYYLWVSSGYTAVTPEYIQLRVRHNPPPNYRVRYVLDEPSTATASPIVGASD